MSEDILKRLQACAIAGCSPPERALALEAANEIARLREERRWVPVSERLPDEDEQVLWLLNDNATIDLTYTKPFNATHWKPKPLPPRLKGEA